jgi:hypothetical protein
MMSFFYMNLLKEGRITRYDSYCQSWSAFLCLNLAHTVSTAHKEYLKPVRLSITSYIFLLLTFCPLSFSYTGHEQMAEELLPVPRPILRQVPLPAHPRSCRSKMTAIYHLYCHVWLPDCLCCSTHCSPSLPFSLIYSQQNVSREQFVMLGTLAINLFCTVTPSSPPYFLYLPYSLSHTLTVP